MLAATSLGQPWRPRRGVLGWGSASGVLAALYPAVTVLLAARLLGERIGSVQRTGIGIRTLAVATPALG
ncbi:hypothetical protein [Amycolatopsis speibonae]|uniref:MFS transporter n=1 Tax=Amycolatopsis speibonae TaxID=1450224 RepID=A0ABV7P072_9PSEU